MAGYRALTAVWRRIISLLNTEFVTVIPSAADRPRCWANGFSYAMQQPPRRFLKRSAPSDRDEDPEFRPAGLLPWPSMRDRCSSIVNREVRTTRVPIGELPSPRIKSPSVNTAGAQMG
jgi:hypothetical protein